jgi:hypothetical protein
MKTIKNYLGSLSDRQLSELTFWLWLISFLSGIYVSSFFVGGK